MGRFLRGVLFFLGYVFLYLWSGAVYKLVYNLGHEKSAATGMRSGMRMFQEIASYQFQFRLDAWTRLTYLFGADFGRYIGSNPSLSTLRGGPEAMAAWQTERARELIALANERGTSLWADNALRDAFMLGLNRGWRPPDEATPYRHVAWLCINAREWRWMALRDFEPQSQEAAERLIHNYPESPSVPQVLGLLMNQYRQTYDFARVDEVAHQLVEEYPRSSAALETASLLAQLPAAQQEYAQAAALLAPALDGAEEQDLGPQEQLQLQNKRLNLASYYLQAGRPAEARAQYEHAARAVGEAVARRQAGLGVTEEDSSTEDRSFFFGSWKQDLEGLQKGLEAGLQEVWVAEMFAALEVPDQPLRQPDRKPRYTVRGRVLRGEQPLAGLKVGLPVRAAGPGGGNSLPQLPLLGAQNADYFTTTDPQGRFTLYDVPAGQYSLILVTDLKSLPSKTVLVETPAPVVVKDRNVELPPLRFAPAITPLSPERQTVAAEGSLTLRWEPRPRAARYTVFVAPDHPEEERSPMRWQMNGQGYPDPANVPAECWHRSDLTDTQLQAPLAELRQGVPPQPQWRGKAPEAYYWLVCAFDAQNRLLSTSETYAQGQWPKVTVQTEATGQLGN